MQSRSEKITAVAPVDRTVEKKEKSTMRKNPPKFLSWMAVAGLAWGAGAIYNLYLGGEAHWLKGLYRQKIAIAAGISEPKLIVTGGSGAHYTIDSKTISEEIGRPVVNLGLDGPLGLDVILPSILESVKPGDTVLLIPEYLILESKDGFGEKSGMFSWAIGRPSIGDVPAKQLAMNLMQLGIPSLRWTVKSARDLVEEGHFTGYYDGPLTAQGDPTETKERMGDWWPLTVGKTTPHAVKRIAQFKQEVEDKGGTLLISIPWVYGDTADGQTVENVKATAEQFSQIAPVLVDEDSLNIQDSPALFADTHYHLKPEGREVRSHQLASQLKPLLPKPK